MAENLKERTVFGVVWSGLQKFGSVILAFVSSIVLARLLLPEDYGCVGMLSIFMSVASTFIDGGFGSALIQKKRPTQEDYSTIFYWNLAISVTLYLMLFFSAPLIARFYRTPLLCSVLRVQGVVLIINAIRIVQSNQLRKQLRFKKIAVVNLSSNALSLVVTIWMAWKGYGVWALVAQHLVLSVLLTTVYWATGHWWPLLRFSKQSFKELFNFGGFILLSNLINTFCNNIQGLLIGRIYNSTTMGYYSKARGTEQIPSNLISGIIDQVAYPVLSEAQNDKPYLVQILRKFIGVLAYTTAPLMMLLVVLAEPIFLLLYSDRWLPSVPYFQILCFAGLFSCLQGVNYFAVAAVGKSGSLFRGTVIKRGIGLVLLVGGLWLFGMRGLLVGMVLTSFVVYLINAILAARHTGYRLMQQFRDLLPIFSITAAAVLAALGVGCLGIGHMYVEAAVQLVAYVAVYMGCSLLFRLQSLTDTKEMAAVLIQKYRKKQ